VSIVAAGSGQAAEPSTPTAVSTAFAQGYLTGDPAVCDLVTPRLQQLFARLAKRAKTCKAGFAAYRADADVAADRDARRALRETVQATQVLIDARAKATATRRVWIAPHSRVGALVADMRAHDIEVRVGKGPSSARVTPTGVVLVDVVRTTPAKLVLYTESTSGTIWRLTSSPYRIGTPIRAGHGIAVRPVPAARAFPYPQPSGSSPVRVGVTTTSDQYGFLSFLLTLTPEKRVDAVLIGSLLTPPVVGSGSGDATAIADRLVRAWQQGDAKGLCAEMHPRLRLSQSMFGENCEIARDPATAVRVTSPGLDGWSADGTSIVAVRVGQGSDALTVYHVVTPLASGQAVTGMFFDFDEIAAQFLRPI
jgi:hypothetical protein